jgi:hypothetical protein
MKSDGGCGKEFEVDEEKCKKEPYMQCPHCLELSKNPFYEGGGDYTPNYV